jgi:hypothetical protein
MTSMLLRAWHAFRERDGRPDAIERIVFPP